MAAEAHAVSGSEVRTLEVAKCLKKLTLCLVYIGVSTILIRFNKMMMQEDHFPFALPLSAIHMLVSSLLCAMLYLVAPSMYPAMAATEGKRLSLAKWFAPIAACFAVMLYGSNQAYAYCSVTLLQFMKEANVMIVFLISCAVDLQSVNRLRVALIVWVIIGASISVSGDIRFSLIGIAFQAASQLAECSRVVLGEFVLTGRKFDPLTYTMFLAPSCFLVLAVANFCHWDARTWPALIKCWPLLLLNASVAFVLNILVASVIKELSAVGFVLTGLTKDIVIVILSCFMFSEPITTVQWSAFGMTLAGVGLWSLMKVMPDCEVVLLFEKVLCMERPQPSETATLIEKKV